MIYVLLALPLIYLGVLMGFYSLQDFIIFRNSRLHEEFKFDFSFDFPFEELHIRRNDGVELSCLHFKSNESKGIVFYHHGNTGNLQDWGGKAELFLKEGYDVFMYDYRGYGKSGGKIKIESTLHRDASFLYKEILKKFPFDQIIIYGISLGSGIAAKLASKKNCKCLILETPYYNFLDIIKHHYPFLPVALISKYRFRTNLFLKKVMTPILIIHGTKDEVIPYESSLKLKAKYPHIEFTSIEGGGHSDLTNYDVYHEAIRSKLN